jgi:hypothetical protein
MILLAPMTLLLPLKTGHVICSLSAPPPNRQLQNACLIIPTKPIMSNYGLELPSYQTWSQHSLTSTNFDNSTTLGSYLFHNLQMIFWHARNILECLEARPSCWSPICWSLLIKIARYLEGWSFMYNWYNKSLGKPKVWNSVNGPYNWMYNDEYQPKFFIKKKTPI